MTEKLSLARIVLSAALTVAVAAPVCLLVNDFLPRPYKTSNLRQDSDDILLARMLFGEARNCTDEEMIAVAFTALNRARDGKKWNGETLKDAILSKYQYSCFNSEDPNRRKLMDPYNFDSASFDHCLDISRQILSGKYRDPTKGATHYFNPKAANPKWATQIQEIGHIQTSNGPSKHKFYKEK